MKLTIKLLLSLVLLLAFLAAIYLGVVYFLGLKAEESLNDEVKILSNNSLFEVQSYHYKRGILSSTAETQIILRKKVAETLDIDDFPDVLKKVLLSPVTLRTHVRHGPYCKGLLVRACAETTALFTPEAEQEIIKFFGTKNPIHIRNTIQFDGSGLINISLNSMDYKELSGIQIKFAGLSGILDYRDNYADYSWHISLPKFYMKLADQGGVLLLGLNYQATNHPNPDSVDTGMTRLELNKLVVDTHLDRPVNFNLLNLLTPFLDVKLGYLFNPSLTFQGAKLTIDELAFALDSVQENDLVTLAGALNIDALALNDEEYGPFITNMNLSQVHGASLKQLKNYLASLSEEKLTPGEWRDKVLQFLRGPGAGLFTHEPKLELQRFYFKMPEGEIRMSGKIALSPTASDELEDFGTLAAKIEANLDYVIPLNVVTNIVENQVINLFLSGKDAPQASDLKNVLRTTQFMIKSMIGNLVALSYTQLKNGILSGTIKLTGGKLYLNGKEYHADDEDDDTDIESIYSNSDDAHLNKLSDKPIY